MAIWSGPAPKTCELGGEEIKMSFVDGRTRGGPWAVMCLDCFKRVGVGLGTGRGQLYELKGEQFVKTGG